MKPWESGIWAGAPGNRQDEPEGEERTWMQTSSAAPDFSIPLWGLVPLGNIYRIAVLEGTLEIIHHIPSMGSKPSAVFPMRG